MGQGGRVERATQRDKCMKGEREERLGVASWQDKQRQATDSESGAQLV